MIILIIWLLLGAIGALAIGAVARDMVRRRRNSDIELAFALEKTVSALQHLALVWLAIRAIENYRGGPISFGVVVLTAAQLLVTPSACLTAAVLLGWVQLRRKKGDS